MHEIAALRREVDALTKRVDRLDDQRQSDQLNRIEATLTQLHQEVHHMAGELAQLQADVAAESTVIDSAITLLQGIKKALDDAIASGNPAALAALSADIEAKTKALADAVVANTPTPPPTP